MSTGGKTQTKGGRAGRAAKSYKELIHEARTVATQRVTLAAKIKKLEAAIEASSSSAASEEDGAVDSLDAYMVKQQQQDRAKELKVLWGLAVAAA